MKYTIKPLDWELGRYMIWYSISIGISIEIFENEKLWILNIRDGSLYYSFHTVQEAKDAAQQYHNRKLEKIFRTY
jgi:hypothetical protein